jgi:PrtD family type I secretion system ABC transporter
MNESLISKSMASCRRAFYLVAVVSLCINVLMLSSALYMMQVYDRVLSTRNVDTLIVLSAIMLFALVVLGILDGLRNQTMVRIGGWLDKQLSDSALSSSISIGLASGGTTAQGLRDLSSLRSYMASPSVFPLFDAPFAPIFLIAIFMIHPTLGWISLVGAIVLFILGVINDRVTKQVSAESNSASVSALNYADSAVRNADVIGSMGILPGLTRKFREVTGEAYSKQRMAADRSGILSSFAKGLRLVLQSAVLGVGAWLVIQQEITPGVMIAASIVMGRALAPVEQSITGWRAFTVARITYARLEKLLEADPTIDEATTLPDPQGKVLAEEVTYIPPGSDKSIVRQVGFKLDPGEAMGLVGPSASGKSTLGRLIIGTLIPTRGVVRMDGANMAKWDPQDRGPHVGYLPQEIEFFDGTVRENIARLTDAEDEEVVAAAQLAGVHEMVLELPDGYETKIGTGGIRLSGGQRQRLALARAVFRTPKLLVLDEPNSNLDATGEQKLIDAIGQMRGAGSTIIVIAHRPSILAQMDKVLVLKEGEVSMSGPRDEVLEKLKAPLKSMPTEVPKPAALTPLSVAQISGAPFIKPSDEAG